MVNIQNSALDSHGLFFLRFLSLPKLSYLFLVHRRTSEEEIGSTLCKKNSF